jgi:hypothetical protein
MSDLVSLDTETTGLSLDDDIWEFAGIRRNGETGEETELHLFIKHDNHKCLRLPPSFLSDHNARYDAETAVARERAAELIADFLAPRDGKKVHVVGANPSFDTQRLSLLLWNVGLLSPWHYHLIDVEPLTLGWLAAMGIAVAMPWDSNDLSRKAGLEPPEKGRHTAMGDARWTLDLYDRIMSTAKDDDE